jgi:periplasmic copper chaperone A
MAHRIFIAITAALAAASSAYAHITLENQESPVGGPYKAVMQVPHGCGGTATTAIRVRIPEGILAVKPMPKPGWKLDTVSGKYPHSFSANGVKANEGITELRWSGGNLPNAYYDEFIFISTIADELEAGKSVYFPVVQECEKGVHRWIDIPSTGGHSRDETSEPAPGLKLLPKR